MISLSLYIYIYIHTNNIYIYIYIGGAFRTGVSPSMGRSRASSPSYNIMAYDIII